MPRTELCERFGLEAPVFAFTIHPEVAAAVSRAGGLGVLGALRFTAEELEEALTYIEGEVGGRPYGVDVVMPASSQQVDATEVSDLTSSLEAMIPDGHKQFVEEVLQRHEVPSVPDDVPEARGVLGWTDLTARAQLDVIFSGNYQPALIANALGPPPEDVVARAHEHDMAVAALVGTVEHARAQRDVGVDVIVAVGTEAGGHTGEVSTMVLVPEVVDAVDPLPVLAAGGIGRGRQAAAAVALGAQGAWTGSMWLTTSEYEMAPVLRNKLLEASHRDTVRSRSMTGKPARQLRTGWTDVWDAPDTPAPLKMPLQWLLTADAQQRMQHWQPPDLIGTPVGQIVGSMNEVRPVKEVVDEMVSEYDATIKRLTTG